MVAANVHPKAIQSRLGHSSISVTLDTYGHLLPSLDEEVADSLEAAISRPFPEILLHMCCTDFRIDRPFSR